MLSTDRQEFESQLSTLFGGYPQFLTPPRIEAYWRGLQKMSISVFIRCVDHALGEQGSEKLPTVNTLWQISKQLRAMQARPEPKLERKFEPFHAHGQRCMLAYLQRKGATSWDSMRLMIAEKNRLIEQFREIAAEDAVTGTEIREALFAAFDRLWHPMPANQIDLHRQNLQQTGHA